MYLIAVYGSNKISSCRWTYVCCSYLRFLAILLFFDFFIYSLMAYACLR